MHATHVVDGANLSCLQMLVGHLATRGREFESLHPLASPNGIVAVVSVLRIVLSLISFVCSIS